MRSMQSRLKVARVIAMMLVALPILLSPAPTVWAADDVDIDIDDIGKVKRGEKKVMLRADVEKSDLICTLTVKYADGNTDTVGNDESDKNGTCEIAFDVPDRKSVVGNATVKLKVETKSGADRGKASRNFTVRGRRGD
jgi:hypothetical protein